MNYKKHYELLIKSRQNLERDDKQLEKHHIKPRCMGGSDNSCNLVRLTLREHFIAHLLLTKMHPGNTKLLYAFIMMLNTRDIKNSRDYEELRTEYMTKMSKDFKGRMHVGKRWSYHPHTKKVSFSTEIPKDYVAGRLPKSGRPLKPIDTSKFLIEFIRETEVRNNKRHGLFKCPKCEKPFERQINSMYYKTTVQCKSCFNNRGKTASSA